MLRFIFAIMLFIAIASGVVALVILGEAWLLQKLFTAELWQIALIVLGSMAVVTFVIVQFMSAASATPFIEFPDWDDEEEDDQEEYIGPPPWRRSASSKKKKRR